MAELKIYLSNGLSERFRRIAMSVYGYGRGSLSKAAEEAFAKWCTEHDLSHSSSANPSQSDSTTVPAEKTVSRIDPDERKTNESETKSQVDGNDQRKG